MAFTLSSLACLDLTILLALVLPCRVAVATLSWPPLARSLDEVGMKLTDLRIKDAWTDINIDTSAAFSCGSNFVDKFQKLEVENGMGDANDSALVNMTYTNTAGAVAKPSDTVKVISASAVAEMVADLVSQREQQKSADNFAKERPAIYLDLLVQESRSRDAAWGVVESAPTEAIAQSRELSPVSFQLRESEGVRLLRTAGVPATLTAEKPLVTSLRLLRWNAA